MPCLVNSIISDTGGGIQSPSIDDMVTEFTGISVLMTQTSLTLNLLT